MVVEADACGWGRSGELRSPLARLAFASELARTANDRDAAIDEINKQIKCLADLVGELVHLSRAEGERKVNADEELSLDSIVDEVMARCALQAQERGCRLVLTGSTTVEDIERYPFRPSRVLPSIAEAIDLV